MRSLNLLAALAVLATVACSEDPPPPDEGAGGAGASGGSGGSGGSIGPAFDPAAFCQQRRAASCEMLSRCYPAFLKGTEEDCLRQKDGAGFGDVASDYTACLAEATPVAYRISQGAITYDADAAAACLADFEAECPTGELWQTNVLSPCPISRFTRGQVTTGDRCQTTSDCEEGLFCRIQTGDCYGACTRFAAQGEACGGGACNSAPCAPGFACGTPIVPGACGRCEPSAASAQPAEGEDCLLRVLPSMCQEGSICKRATAPMTPNKCAPRGKLGDPCLETWECEQQLVCGEYPAAGGSGSCIERIAVGEPCSPFPGPPAAPLAIFAIDPCVREAVCRPDPDDMAVHVCTALPVEGEPCVPAKASAPTSGLGCAGAVCMPITRDTGTCGPLLDDGASCSGWVLEIWQNSCEPGLTCRAQGFAAAPSCHAPSAAGEDCKEHTDCASGRCVGLEDNTTGAKPKKCVEADFICDL